MKKKTKFKVGDYVRITGSKRHNKCFGVVKEVKEIIIRGKETKKASYIVEIIHHSNNNTCNGQNKMKLFFEEHLVASTALDAWRNKRGKTGV